MRNIRIFLCLAALLFVTVAPFARAQDKPAAKPFELLDGDRVVLVGGTLIEREGQLGHIEAMLTSRFPGRHVTFRNLGQSGDTVLADARNLNSGWAAFGPADQGFKRLEKLIGEIKPTVIIANYGMTESFEGEKRLPEFTAGYERLLDMMKNAAGGTPRVVLMSPNYHEDLGKPLADPAEHNGNLEVYRDAIAKLAERRGYRFVDLFTPLKEAGSDQPWTDNGVHLKPSGYHRLAGVIAASLGLRPDAASGSAEPDARTEALRRVIVEKNAAYFNYWRPQNDTYILGYRKKEQGRNAVELLRFIPLAEAKEKEIARLRDAAK